MLIEQCQLGFVYSKSTDEVCITLPSLTTLLYAFAADLSNAGFPPELSDSVVGLTRGIEQSGQDFEQEMKEELDGD